MLYASGTTSEIRSIPDAIIVRRKGGAFLTLISLPCPLAVVVAIVAIALAAILPCHRLPPYIEVRLTLIPQSLKDRLCVMSLMTSSAMWMNTCHMQATTTNYSDKPHIMSLSYPSNNFMETDATFLEFEDDLDNLAGGSSSMGNNAGSSSQPPATPTPRIRAQSRLLELEHHVTINGCILMTIALGAEKEYIIVVKGDLQRFFVLDFNDQAMLKLVEHQMLTTFKEFWADCHIHFKKYSDLEEARANPPNVLVGCHEYWHFLCDHYMSRTFQHELAEKKEKLIDRVELFRKTHVQAETFVSQAAEDTHLSNLLRNQMMELQSQENSQPLFGDEICDQV
ncbi:CACTA en-spm transposon protein [Cucumis melo var. makuwa]|uniref:CACTA en-spm transposon protein n=1 Tax=Cucumis melo var. makuwa TaxID=1194695 RepID=A0A5A7VKR5_CUCMM|nr:CACTA en-spm transposon protein [Cucumis melo var. makuwa]